MRVAPCSNVGTNLQCEMDPVSQAKASSDLAQHGLDVVGWYHSHPTFAPTPSLRDIDTQSTFQVSKFDYCCYFLNFTPKKCLQSACKAIQLQFLMYQRMAGLALYFTPILRLYYAYVFQEKSGRQRG